MADEQQKLILAWFPNRKPGGEPRPILATLRHGADGYGYYVSRPYGVMRIDADGEDSGIPPEKRYPGVHCGSGDPAAFRPYETAAEALAATDAAWPLFESKEASCASR